MLNFKKFRYLISTLIILYVFDCRSQSENEEAKFEFDHILIFSKNSSVEDSLKNEIFTFGGKLSTKHPNQGTFGHYFIFFNTYIEFIYLEDSVLAKQNESRFRSKYTKRWSNSKNICPFGFGLNLTPFDTNQTDFPLLSYKSLDVPGEDYYLMSSHNKDMSQPLIYISTPIHAYKKMDSINQVDMLFDEKVKDDFRNYLSHPSEIKKLTKLILTVPKEVNGGNIDLIQQQEIIEIAKSDHYGITLVFDHGEQGKEFVLDSHFELKVKY